MEVEQDILAGVPEADWVSTVKENLKKKFPNGITVGNSEIQIDKQSRREMTFSRYMQLLYNKDPQLRADKLRATNNADEILHATTDWVNEGLKHSRKDNIKDFARGNVLLRVGGNDYAADVVVGTRENGSMVMYDILHLQPTSFTKKETDAAITVNPSPGVGRSTASVSNDSIAQAEKKDNGKFSFEGNTANRYSLKGKYWRPNLSSKEWELLNHRMDAEINDPTHALDEITQWAYADEKGTTVFAIYGIGDGTEATPLYASGGRTAYADYKAFMDAGKRFDYGTDRNRRALNRWFKDRRSKERSSNGGIPDAQGRQPANGHDRVSTIQGEGNGRGSAGYGQQTGGEVNTRFSLKAPVEETDKLLALHNKDEDSQGRELTEAQREYFKDSKVVDGEGRLLTLYHGTGTEFTVFAIYGIGDGTEATPLYASGGKTAAADYQAFMKSREEFWHGTDRSTEAFNRLFKTLRREFWKINGNLPDAQRRSTENGHDRVSAERAGNDGRKSAGHGQQTGGEVNNRYSLKGTEESRELSRLKKETEALKERVSYWKGQTKESTAVTTDKKSIEKKARQIVKDYGAQVDTAEIGRP